MKTETKPLFVCHANCCRSVLAHYLYRHLTGAASLSAGLSVGTEIAPQALQMLKLWGVDAREHRARQLDRALCEEASAIFVMGPNYLHRLLKEYGRDLASKAYLFADPFAKPRGFKHGEFKVIDPSFDHRPAREVIRDFPWLRERVLQIRLAMLGEGRPLVPATTYEKLWQEVDPHGH